MNGKLAIDELKQYTSYCPQIETIGYNTLRSARVQLVMYNNKRIIDTFKKKKNVVMYNFILLELNHDLSYILI